MIGQVQFANGHIDRGPWHLGLGPAVYFLCFVRRTMPGSHGEREDVARIVEMYELFQALDIAIVKELFLEVRPRCFGCGTLRGRHGDVARRGRLHSAVPGWCKLCPLRIRIGPRAGTASEKRPYSEVPVAESIWIPGEAEEIRGGLVIESVPRIQRQAQVGVAEAGEERPGTRRRPVV